MIFLIALSSFHPRLASFGAAAASSIKFRRGQLTAGRFNGVVFVASVLLFVPINQGNHVGL
jgi:hypothetical protein